MKLKTRMALEPKLTSSCENEAAASTSMSDGPAPVSVAPIDPGEESVPGRSRRKPAWMRSGDYEMDV